jgi:peptide/nickel transport system substrate-binding protein
MRDHHLIGPASEIGSVPSAVRGPGPSPTAGEGQTRRDILKRGGVAIAVSALGPAVLSGGSSRRRNAVNASRPLVIAAPATPTGFDREFNFTQGDVEQIAAVFRPGLTWKVGKAPGFPSSAGVFAQTPTPAAGAIERWELKNGGRTAIFHLTPGLISNFGNELTAADALWTYKRTYAIKGGESFLFFEGGYGNPHTSSIKQIDKYTFSITAECPTPMLIKTQGSAWQWYIDSTEAKKHATPSDPWAQAWIKATPAGWGDYTLETFTPGQEIIWNAKPRGGGTGMVKPSIQRVIYQEVPDSSTRTALVARGDADVAEWLTPDQLRTLANTKGVRVLYFPYNFQTYVIPNQKFQPFTNVLVRQALAYATPQMEIGKSVYNGHGVPMRSVIPPSYPDYNPSYFKYNYDPAKARALLKKAGFGNGLQFALSFTSAVPETPDVATVLQTAWRAVGIDITLNEQPAAVFLDAIYGPHKNYQCALHREGAVVPDPIHSTYQFFYSTSLINTAQVNDPSIDAALNRALCAPTAQRQSAFNNVQRLIMDKAVWAPIWVSGVQYAIQDRLQGFTWAYTDGFLWQNARFV